MTGEAFNAKALASAFGRRVRELRERQGLTQDRLAKRSGMQASVMGRLERGKHEPRLSAVLSVARGLGVSPGELLDNLAAVEQGMDSHPVLQLSARRSPNAGQRAQGRRPARRSLGHRVIEARTIRSSSGSSAYGSTEPFPVTTRRSWDLGFPDVRAWFGAASSSCAGGTRVKPLGCLLSSATVACSRGRWGARTSAKTDGVSELRSPTSPS
jgi:transcriptional regulator with XRE-family HTH domain